MATIVKIKRADEYIAIELDTGESLKIPSAVDGMYRLSVGRIIDATEYAQIKEESERHRCKSMALDYLAIAPRSAAEMERYLRKTGFDHGHIRGIVTRLAESGYIDDADYAARYISNRLSRKFVGRNLLFNDLQKKGVPRNIIKKALKESEAIHSNFDELYKPAVKKYASLKNKKNGISKLDYFLQSRGFDSDLVASVIHRIRSEEKNNSDDDIFIE